MKIIVHVGAGKTGTSSIQKTLKDNQSTLNMLGFHYMGLVLEEVHIKKYNWQKLPASTFGALDDKTTYREALDIINNTISEMSAKGIHTLIWSNESFLVRNGKIIPILQTLANDNEIEIIAYVRKHESWIRSAYIQWGIKHKGYRGKLRNFQNWYTPGRVHFHESLKPWIDNFQSKVFVKNMGAQANLVKSFLEFCKIKDDDIDILKSNESPSNEELILRALYNNNFNNPISPNLFDRQILLDSSSQTPKQFLDSLMPTEEDMDRVSRESDEDRKLLNSLLESQGEKKFSEENIKQKVLEVEDGKLLMFLSRIVMRQSIELDKLKQEVRENKVI